LYKSLKDTKLKITPTCFGSYAIAYDPKHVGVIFNFVSFKLLYNVDFSL